MCDIFTENSNVEVMSKEPMPEPEDTSTAANHSFPTNTSHNSETRQKRKSGKSQALSQLLAFWRKKNRTAGEGCATEIDYVFSGGRRLTLFDEFVASS